MMCFWCVEPPLVPMRDLVLIRHSTGQQNVALFTARHWHYLDAEQGACLQPVRTDEHRPAGKAETRSVGSGTRHHQVLGAQVGI